MTIIIGAIHSDQIQLVCDSVRTDAYGTQSLADKYRIYNTAPLGPMIYMGTGSEGTISFLGIQPKP